MSNAITMDAYSPIGDLVCIGLCWTMVILVCCAYVRRTTSYRMFLGILIALILAAYSSILYRTMLNYWQPSFSVPIAIFRVVMHASMFLVLALYFVYIAEVTRLSTKEKRVAAIIAFGSLVVCVLYDIIGTATGVCFRIDETGQVFLGPSVFSYGYLAFVVMNLTMLIYIRKRIYKRIMIGFYLTVALAVLVNLAQRLNGQSSFTIVSFTFPVIAMLYFLHASPYDTQLGAVDRTAMEDFILQSEQKHRPFGYMSLYMPDFDQSGAVLPEKLQAAMRLVATRSFRGSVLFFVGKGHYILTYPLSRNPDAEKRIRSTMEFFAKNYEVFHYDYKIVIGQSIDQPGFRDYISFIRSIHHTMKINTVYDVDDSDNEVYYRYAYILSELNDIYNRHDLDDPRVLVYCQPVFDVSLHRYDTAEALMRLDLEKTGLVNPDDFIHIAEEYGFIHVLTEIILNKTCREIYRLTQEGFRFSRISVNIAAEELKEVSFCDDVMGIIRRSGITGERIAIELTESENESDFLVAQERITQLRKQGIQFYLDDFGTGYSNMERIMQLPFDIIKFDRSMVLVSASDSKSATIVNRLAQLFAELHYSVLYEGIETDSDEDRCCHMSASYLQGFKYSKPVPIHELTNFFEKVC